MSFLLEKVAMVVFMPVVLVVATRWRRRSLVRAHPDGVEARLRVLSGAVRYVPGGGMAGVALIASRRLAFAEPG